VSKVSVPRYRYSDAKGEPTRYPISSAVDAMGLELLAKRPSADSRLALSVRRLRRFRGYSANRLC